MCNILYIIMGKKRVGRKSEKIKTPRGKKEKEGRERIRKRKDGGEKRK